MGNGASIRGRNPEGNRYELVISRAEAARPPKARRRRQAAGKTFTSPEGSPSFSTFRYRTAKTNRERKKTIWLLQELRLSSEIEQETLSATGRRVGYFFVKMGLLLETEAPKGNDPTSSPPALRRRDFRRTL